MSTRRETSSSTDEKLGKAVAIGLSVKSLFLLLGVFVIYNWSSRYVPTLQYFMIISGLGAFLAGLLVGFITKNKTTGAFYGLFCAFLPTLVYSIITPARTPIGGLIFVFMLGPFDVLAVVGGAIGASIKVKRARSEMGRLGTPDRYVDAFCGRMPKSVLARHYTDSSPEKLNEIYEKANLIVIP